MKKIWESNRDRIEGPFLPAKAWNFSGIRPANYPYRRIAALGCLLSRHWETGIFSEFVSRFKSTVSIGEKKGYNNTLLKPFYEFFCVDSGDYWSTHYTLGGKRLANSQKLVGQDRSREIAINILIPLGLIYARASKSALLEKVLKALYQSRKNPAESKPVRFMKRYVLGGKREMLDLLATDKQTQGLIQVFQDYCAQNGNNCFQCPFPAVVEGYFS